MAYLPPENANVGEELLVEYLGEQYPVTVQTQRRDRCLRPGEHEGARMRILCCVKRVPITGGRMVLTADAQAIETKHLGFTISPHEECGVEEAVRIVEAGGGEVVVLTLGPDGGSGADPRLHGDRRRPRRSISSSTRSGTRRRRQRRSPTRSARRSRST